MAERTRGNRNIAAECNALMEAKSAELARLRAENERMRYALELWKCVPCDGFGEEYGAFDLPRVCSFCDGTGINPVATAALTPAQAPAMSEPRSAIA
jgi:hypothetical protein